MRRFSAGPASRRIPLKHRIDGHLTGAAPPNQSEDPCRCQALEDAVTLAPCFDGAPDVAAALRSYDLLRRPRTQAITRAGVPTFPPLSVGDDANARITDGARRTDCVSSPGAAHFVGNPRLLASHDPMCHTSVADWRHNEASEGQGDAAGSPVERHCSGVAGATGEMRGCDLRQS